MLDGKQAVIFDLDGTLVDSMWMWKDIDIEFLARDVYKRQIPGLDIPQVSIIKGDAKSVSIAAASVMAKVTRDHMMAQYGELYPQYGFAKHKGYGTAAHIAALKEFGPCPIHRRSFIKNFV